MCCEKNSKKENWRVAFLVSNMMTYGGTERVASILTRELSAFYECWLLTAYQVGDSVYPLGKNVKWFNVCNQKVRLFTHGLLIGMKLAEFIKNKKIGTLIVVGRNNSYIPFVVKLICKDIKMIFCEHNSIAMSKFKQSKLLKIKCSIYNRLVINLSDKIILLTDKEKDLYKKIKNIKDDKIEVIYNPIEDKLLFNKDNNYDTSSNKIITVGGLCDQKGYDYLLLVAAKVFSKHPDWQWDIYGNDADNKRDVFAHKISEYKLENNVKYKGVTENLYTKYKDYAFAVMTSKWEGFGMTLIEAQSHQLPLVSFDIYSGPSDIIEDNINGYLIKMFDIEEMSSKICYLIENQNKRMEMSSHARDGLWKFNKRTVVNKWKEVLEPYLK